MKRILLCLFIISILFVSFISCDLFGGGSDGDNIGTPSLTSKVLVTYDGTKGDCKEVEINLSSSVIDDDFFDMISDSYTGVSKMSFIGVKHISGKYCDGINDTDLKELYFDESIQSIGKNAFSRSTKVEKIKIDGKFVDIADTAFYNSDKTSFEIEDEDLNNKCFSLFSKGIFKFLLTLKDSDFKVTGLEDRKLDVFSNKKTDSVNPPNLDEDLYIFKGYFTKAGNGSEGMIFDSNGEVWASTSCTDSDSNWIESSTVLFPHWSVNGYTILFDKNGGSGSMDPQIVGCGKNKPINKCLFTPPTGKSFGYWERDNSDKTTYTDGVTINDIANAGETITLKAVWLDGYTVTFYRNYSETDVEIYKSVHALEGEYLPEIGIPEREGFKFDGWFTDNACNPDSEFINDFSDKNVYAKWIPIIYTISFDTNVPDDAEIIIQGKELKSLSVVYGGVAKLSERQIGLHWHTEDKKVDRVFLGWSKDKNAKIPTYKAASSVVPIDRSVADIENAKLTTTSGSNVVLYAIWEDVESRQVGMDNATITLVLANGVDYDSVKPSPYEYLYYQNVDGKFAPNTNNLQTKIRIADGTVSCLGYKLEGFYTSRKEGSMVIDAKGELVYDSSDSVVMEYVQKNDKDEIIWIGGDTELFAHWTKIN